MYKLEDKDLFIELLHQFSENCNDCPGNCMVHSVWEEHEFLLPFLTKGSEFRSDANWTNASLYQGDLDRFSVRGDATIEQGTRPPGPRQKIARWASVFGEILAK